jgi:replication-associated recombination protein RarA
LTAYPLSKELFVSKRFSRLTEKYRPRKVDDFIGLSKIKDTLRNFLAEPYAAAFLFIGPPGCGKTAVAMAMAEALHSKPLHLASETCNYDNLDKLLRECEMCPTFWNGQYSKFHFILIDEIDSTTATAQRRLLAKLDASELIENAIFVFTTNTTKRKGKGNDGGLEERFISRCIQLDFSMWGASKEIADFLGRVWRAEGGRGEEPNWERVVTDKKSNVRDCLQYVEAELLARGRNGSFAEPVVIRTEENCKKIEGKSGGNSLWPCGPRSVTA